MNRDNLYDYEFLNSEEDDTFEYGPDDKFYPYICVNYHLIYVIWMRLV
jgi:hypothetical protein